MKSAAKPTPSKKTPYENTSKTGKKPVPGTLKAQIISKKPPIKEESSSEYTSSESSDSSDSSDSDSSSQEENFENEFIDDSAKKSGQDNQSKDEDENVKKILTESEKIALRIQQLKKQYDNLDMDELTFKKKDKKKLRQVAKFLKKKKDEKEKLNKKMEKIKKKQAYRKKKKQEAARKQLEEDKIRKLKEIRKRSDFAQKMKQRREEQQERLEEVEEFYEKFEDQTQLFKKIENFQKKKRKREQEQRKKYLQMRRKQKSQIIDLKEIKEHMKNQDKLLEEITSRKQTEKQHSLSQIIESNRQMREKIYISNKYHQILEQEQEKQRLRQKGSEMLKKRLDYAKVVKRDFMPVVVKENEEEEEKDAQEDQDQVFEINGKKFRKVKKDRYLKGNKCGQVTVNVPVALSQQQLRRVGNSYLQYLHRIPKKRTSSSVQIGNSTKHEVVPPSSTSRIIQIPKIPHKKGKIFLPKNPSRYEVENLIKSLKARDQNNERKEKFIKITNRSLDGASSHHNPEKDQLDDSMIDNIERKLNLLKRL